jgi:hypothetical protein
VRALAPKVPARKVYGTAEAVPFVQTGLIT